MNPLLKHESERTEAECGLIAEAKKLRQEAIDAEVKRLLTPDGIHELMQGHELWADEGFQLALAAFYDTEIKSPRYLLDVMEDFATSKAKVPPIEYYLSQIGPMEMDDE